MGFHPNIISNLQSCLSQYGAASSHQETGTSLWTESEKNSTSSKSSSHFKTTAPTALTRFRTQLFEQGCLAFSKRSGVAKGGVGTGVFVRRCLQISAWAGK